jgi:hypothetical protein
MIRPMTSSPAMPMILLASLKVMICPAIHEMICQWSFESTIAQSPNCAQLLQVSFARHIRDDGDPGLGSLRPDNEEVS